MDISFSSEDVKAFQRIYKEKSEIVEYMTKFGNPLDKIVAELIKKANEK